MSAFFDKYRGDYSNELRSGNVRAILLTLAGITGITHETFETIMLRVLDMERARKEKVKECDSVKTLAWLLNYLMFVQVIDGDMDDNAFDSFYNLILGLTEKEINVLQEKYEGIDVTKPNYKMLTMAVGDLAAVSTNYIDENLSNSEGE